LTLPRVAGSWVKGHQDDTTTIFDLPFKAQLNLLVDDLIGRFQCQSPDDYVIPTPEVPSIFSSIYQHTGDLKPAIRDLTTYEPLCTRLMEENEWTEAAYLVVDWISHGRAPKKRLHRCRSTSTLKFLHSWLPKSHQQQYDINNEKDANYPNCTGQKTETEDRILQRETAINSLRTLLSKLETPTDLINCVLHGFHSWIALSQLTSPKTQSNAPMRPQVPANKD
jgi:hypothetical protein